MPYPPTSAISPSPYDITAAYKTIRGQTPWNHKGSAFRHHRVLPFATLAPWLSDTDFMAAWEAAKDFTLVDIYRCFELWSIARQTGLIEGDILEVGVWRGGTGSILARAVSMFTGKKVYLADTFSGVVKAGEHDVDYVGGEHGDTSVELVSDFIESLELKNVELLKGIFPDDTKDRVTGSLALLHCDVDVYQSGCDIVEWCLPRLLIGGVMVFDDYGFQSCEGITKFCNELRERSDLRFIHNLNGHAIFVKVA